MVAVNAREARLIEAVDGDVVHVVLLDDLDRFLVGFEGVHQNQRDIHAVLGIKILWGWQCAQSQGG